MSARRRQDWRDRRDRLEWRVRSQVSCFEPRLSVALALGGAIPPYTASNVRVALFRAGGLRIGPRSLVFGRLWVAGGPSPTSRLEIGADCILNDGCRFDLAAAVTIDDGAYIGHEVAVLTGNHEQGTRWQRCGTLVAEPVRIGRGAWIGARSTILAGVEVGDGAIVAAGAVVTRSVPSDTLVGGVPARVIRALEP